VLNLTSASLKVFLAHSRRTGNTETGNKLAGQKFVVRSR
jgi:hypothetical protein